MKKILITLVLIFSVFASVACTPVSTSQPSTSETQALITTSSESTSTSSTISDTSDVCDGDELCFTFEAEARAWELFDTFKVADTFAVPTEVIYMGYYDGMPTLADYEGVVKDPSSDRHYVFAVFADTSYINA